MKAQILLIVIIFIGLYGCDGNRKKDCCESDKKIDSSIIKKSAPVFHFDPPIIQDTIKQKRLERPSYGDGFGNYNPLYIGQRKDTIYVSYKPDLEKYFRYNINSYHWIDSSRILLLTDTTKIVSDYLMVVEGKDNLNWKTKPFMAFPVIVVNTTNDTLILGSGEHIPIFMEAIDTSGKWRQIQKPYIYICGTGLNNIILPPNEIAVTSAPIFNGSFKTKLRLRLNNAVSKEFYGTINPEQFKMAW